MAESSFNAHELLSKLRGVSSTSILNDMSAKSTPQREVARAGQMSGATNFTDHGSKALGQSLSSSQKRESAMQAEIRVELEKEIKRLQEEVARFRSENKHLQQEKALIDQQFALHKQKTDDIISQLRCRIAVLSKKGQDGNGPKAKFSKQAQNHANPNQRLDSKLAPSVGNPMSQVDITGGPAVVGTSFAEPTFSELMRRSTPTTHDYTNTLRKSQAVPAPASLPLNRDRISNDLRLQSAAGETSFQDGSSMYRQDAGPMRNPRGPDGSGYPSSAMFPQTPYAHQGGLNGLHPGDAYGNHSTSGYSHQAGYAGAGDGYGSYPSPALQQSQYQQPLQQPQPQSYQHPTQSQVQAVPPQPPQHQQRQSQQQQVTYQPQQRLLAAPILHTTNYFSEEEEEEDEDDNLPVVEIDLRS